MGAGRTKRPACLPIGGVRDVCRCSAWSARGPLGVAWRVYDRRRTASTSIHLCGRLRVIVADEPREERLHGRQGRLALAYLLLHRGRPVRRDELIEAVWGQNGGGPGGGGPPPPLSRPRRAPGPGPAARRRGARPAPAAP